MKETKNFIIIDGNALVHRAFHALPPLETKEGELVNAIYGFLLVFFKAVKDFNPGYIAACFDLAAPTFRHKKFPLYKAKRPKAPKELYEQIPKIKKILKSFHVPTFEKQGFEADDLIGTIAKKVSRSKKNHGTTTIILSGDLDTLQIIDRNIKVYTLRKGVKDTVLYDEEKVKARYHVPPSLFVDFKALKGDASDNIPGVAGIGEKTASQLVAGFGGLENIYKEIEQDSKKSKRIKSRIKKLLLQSKDQAFFSKMLAQIEYNVPINFELERCKWIYDKEKITEILKKFQFFRLINSLPPSKEDLEKSQKELFS